MRSLDRLSWYLGRIAAMDTAEIMHRGAEFVRKQSARRYDRGWDFIKTCGPLLAIPKFDARQLRFSSDLLSVLVRESDAVAHGRFELLNACWPLPRIMPPPPEFWHVDPDRGSLSLQRTDYCFAVSFRHGVDVPEIKRVWELNRLQFLVPLAANAAVRNDKYLADLVIGTIISWMSGNPPYRGENWVSGIELALRVLSIAISISFLGIDRLDEAARNATLRFFFAHADWIWRFPSLHSSANNHRIAELAGFIVACEVAPGIPQASSRREESWLALLTEIDKQLYRDGVGAEQAVGYTAFSVELFLTAAVALGREKNLPQRTADRLVKWAEYSLWLMDAQSGIPAIGDFDDCKVIATTQAPEKRYIASVVAAVANIIHRPELSPPGTDRSLRDVIFGSTSHALVRRFGLRTFPEGGYSIIRGGDTRSFVLVFDHGPLGYLSIAAHGHADTLAVWLSIDDRPVIIDAGTYLYHSDRTWRDRFRATALHNTLALDRSSSSQPAGPFNWSTKATARLLTAEALPLPRIVAEHDGYVAKFDAKHRRTVEMVGPSRIAITDELIGTSRYREVTVSFLVNADCGVEPIDTESVLVLSDRNPILRLTAKGPLLPRVVRGDDTGIGWFSPSFGLKQPTNQILFQGFLDKPSTITLEIT